VALLQDVFHVDQVCGMRHNLVDVF
jgi:hypothetical protein